MNSLTYDDILEAAGFGRYQKRTLILLMLVGIMPAFYTLGVVFNMAEPDFRCAIPGMENDTFHIVSPEHERLANASLARDPDTGQFSQCSVLDSSGHKNDIYGQASNVDPNTTVSCTRWVYSTDIYYSSIVSQLNLVCDRKIIRSHATMMYMVGYSIGSVLSGPVGDIFGRKITMLGSMVILSVVGVVFSFTNSVAMLLTLRCFMAFNSVVMFTTAFILMSEFVGPAHRTVAGMAIMYGWVIGMLILVAISYFLRYWTVAQYVFSGASCLLLSYWWLIPESPRWLISRKRYGAARKIIQTMAETNRVKIPEDLLPVETETSDSGVIETFEVESSPSSKELKIWQFCTYPAFLGRLAILSFQWFAVNSCYYGLALNLGDLIEGDIYLNFTLMSIMELLAYVFTTVVLDRAGRKVIYCSLMLLCGLALFATVGPTVALPKNQWINSVLSNAGKFGITGSFGIIFLFSAEQLPTVLRNSGMNLCSAVGRLGGVLSPYIANIDMMVGGMLGKALPLTIFGGIAIIATLLALMLPETSNSRLPENLHDLRNLNKTKSGAHKDDAKNPCKEELLMPQHNANG